MSQIQSEGGAVTQPQSGEIGRDFDRSVDLQRQWALERAECFSRAALNVPGWLRHWMWEADTPFIFL